MIRFSQGGSRGADGFPSKPIYINADQIIAVKPDLDGNTKIVTTGHSTRDGASYSAFIVNESIDEVIAAIEETSKKGAE